MQLSSATISRFSRRNKTGLVSALKFSPLFLGELHRLPRGNRQIRKSEMNSNGRVLAEMLMRNELILTNTIFPHKMAHRTTWETPLRNTDGRHNPYRSQIDYKIVRKAYRLFINDSRSQTGLETFSDHRLERAKLKIQWYKMKKEETETKLNIIYREMRRRNPYTEMRYQNNSWKAMKSQDVYKGSGTI